MRTSTAIHKLNGLKSNAKRIAAVVVSACAIFSAGVAIGQTRPREKASLGVIDEVCFRPIRTPNVDAGAGGALQASGQPSGWRMAVQSSLQSTTSADEPPSSCTIVEDIPAAFVTAWENMATTRILPRIQFRCKVQ